MTFCHETEFQEIFQCSVANLLVLGGLCCSSGKEENFTLRSQSPWVQLWPSTGSRQHFTWKTTLEPTCPSSVTVTALVSLPICVVYTALPLADAQLSFQSKGLCFVHQQAVPFTSRLNPSNPAHTSSRSPAYTCVTLIQCHCGTIRLPDGVCFCPCLLSP